MVERSRYHVYILTGLSLRRVLYVGVTSDLAARIDAHRPKKADGFHGSVTKPAVGSFASLRMTANLDFISTAAH